MDLLTETDKNCNPGFLYRLFGMEKNKLFEVAENYYKAGNELKLSRNYDMAIIAYKKAADTYIKVDEVYNTKECYDNIILCYENMKDYKQAIKYILLILDEHNNNALAKNYEKIAKLYEKDKDYTNSLKYFQICYNIYDVENNVFDKRNILLSIAETSARMHNYITAIEYYDLLAMEYITNITYIFLVKKYWLYASIYRVYTGDIGGCQFYLQEYISKINNYQYDRDYRFITTMIEAVQNNDANLFTDAMNNYEYFKTLDDNIHNLLVNMRRKMSEDELL